MKRPKDQATAVGVLTSGGVESAALLTEAVQRYERVYPIYVQKGFQWERVELSYLKRLLSTLACDGMARLTILRLPVKSIYGSHWSLGRLRTPGSRAPDQAVYLPGRNLLLLSGAALFCCLRKIPVLWIGILRGNPFRDARYNFLEGIGRLIQEALEEPIRIVAPLRELNKAEVIRRWSEVPWGKTFSCLNPFGQIHCGRCQKCAERKGGFRAVGIPDPTTYARASLLRSSRLRSGSSQ